MIDFGALESSIGNVMSMDRIHVEMVLAAIQAVRPKTVVEIGCYSGVSTMAIATAYDEGIVKAAHLIDVSVQQTVKDIAAKRKGFVLHEKPSVDALPLVQPGVDTLVMIDGDHTVEVVSQELSLVLAMKPRCIVAHDVTAEAAGHPKCEGPRWLWEQLQADGWHCIVDCRKRQDASTHRGLLIACRSEKDAVAVRQAISPY